MKNKMILLSNSFDDAVIAYTAKQWYNTPDHINLGRTILQKICYFIKSKGVPIDFEFDIYHYGPYSQVVIQRVLEAKGDKFSHQTISGFYDTLEKAGLFAWSA